MRKTIRDVATLLPFMLLLGMHPCLFGQETESVPSDVFTMSLEDILNLEVTTASKSAERLTDAPGVISVVTKDELERFGGTTLKDVLERVPSLIGSTVYMTDRATIAPRGDQIQPSSSHVLLLINGRPVREALEGGIKSEIYESFPVNVIERIEVIKGPGSVLYGSNAVSAVINVITRKAESNSVTVTGLTDGSKAYGALTRVTLKQGDLSVIGAGRYFEKSEWEIPWRYADSGTDTPVEVTHVIPNRGPGAYLEASYKNLRFMSTFARWEHSYFMGEFQAHGNGTWEKGFADLGYDLQVSEQWNMDLNVTYTRSTFAVDSWPNIERDSHEIVGEWSNTVKPTDDLRIVFGGLYRDIHGEEMLKVEGAEIPINDGDQWNAGLYSQIDYRLMQGVKLIGGFQANKVENIEFDVVPRAGIIWHPVGRISVKALYSQAFRAPSINEIGLNHPVMRGNPDLKPEKVNTVDMGFSYQGEQIQAGVNYFHSQQKDVIFQDRSGLFPLPTYNNIGEIELQGVELEGKWYINRAWLLMGSMLYQTSQDKDGNENVTPIANFGAKAGISYKSEKGFTASVFGIFQGDLDEFYDSPLNLSPGAYQLINLHLSFDLVRLFELHTKHGLSLFVQGDNILDQKIWLPDWGLAPGKSIPVNPGRSVYFGLSASLSD